MTQPLAFPQSPPMAGSIAFALGRAFRQLSAGDWSGAATTLNAKAWLGRYLGGFAALAIPVVALQAAVAWLVPEALDGSGMDYLTQFAIGIAAPVVLLPMGIWTASMTFGRFRPKLRATTLLGGFAEGAVIAVICVAIWVAIWVVVGWINRLGTQLSPS